MPSRATQEFAGQNVVWVASVDRRTTRDVAPADASDLMKEQFTVERLGLRHGGNGEQTKLLAGAYRFESTTVPWVSSALPGVIHIQKSGGQTGGWLEGLAHFMMVEAQTVHPGSSVMISRLIDVLIIRVIRTWAQTKNPGDTGWFGALADPRISRALKAIHEEPFRRWSVADLASAVGMSRSAFAERFSLLVKEATADIFTGQTGFDSPRPRLGFVSSTARQAPLSGLELTWPRS